MTIVNGSTEYRDRWVYPNYPWYQQFSPAIPVALVRFPTHRGVGNGIPMLDYNYGYPRR